MTSAATVTEFIRWFDQIGMDHVGQVGGKNASLGEMYKTDKRGAVRELMTMVDDAMHGVMPGAKAGRARHNRV